MKKMIGIIFVMVFLSVTLFRAQPMTQAENGIPHISPPDVHPYPQTCTFSMCCHDGPVNFRHDDTWTATGVAAYYDTVTPAVAFNKAMWDHLAAAGGDTNGDHNYYQDYYAYGPMQCDLCTNVYYGNEWDVYTTPYWSWLQGYYSDHIEFNPTYTLNPDVNSIEAETLQGFHDPNNPSNIWYIETYTSPWATVTASGHL
jgi:hypothetical protein